jgi:uncharacterized protein
MPINIRHAVATTLFSLFAAGSAAAQSQDCTGRNLLDDLKATDQAAYAAVRKAAADTPHAGHRLWKIEHENARGPSYLLATVPVSDDRVHALTPAMVDALSSVPRVAVDVANVELRRLQEGLATLHGIGKLVLADGSTLASHLTPAEQQTTVKALARSGLPVDLAARAQPWAAMALLSTSACEQRRERSGKMPMNAHIAALAEQRGLGTVDLETIEVRLEATATLPQPIQVSLLKNQVAAVAMENDINETRAQLYLTKDLGAIWPLQMALAKKAGVDEATLNAYHERVVVERSKRLGHRLHQHLFRSGVLVAVDYSLMIGREGLVAQIAASGFTVTAID